MNPEWANREGVFVILTGNGHFANMSVFLQVKLASIQQQNHSSTGNAWVVDWKV